MERITYQIPSNKLYINIGPIHSSIVDTNLEKVPWVVGLTELETAGAAILRDMGKTVYLPSGGTGQPGATNGHQSTILRKIQLVPSGNRGYFGTGGDAGTSGEFYTGYIDIGAQTYGGGHGVPPKIARLN
jgi:hypothetical protein